MVHHSHVVTGNTLHNVHMGYADVYLYCLGGFCLTDCQRLSWTLSEDLERAESMHSVQDGLAQ